MIDFNLSDIKISQELTCDAPPWYEYEPFCGIALAPAFPLSPWLFEAPATDG